MGIVNLHDYMGRVEQSIRDNLRGPEVIGAVLVELEEREGYWERIYIVAWKRADQCGTHRVCINSEDKDMCVMGHYDIKTERDAIGDMLERANLTPGRI